MEVWKDIEGFEGYYQVSNYGRCKSLDRTVKRMSRWGKEIEVVYKGSIMKLHISPKGYRYIQLCKEHIYYTFYVHRLVWETFNGKIPKELEIDHIKPISDGGGDELTNLRIGTRKDNMHNENTYKKYFIPCSEAKKDKISKTSKGKHYSTLTEFKKGHK